MRYIFSIAIFAAHLPCLAQLVTKDTAPGSLWSDSGMNPFLDRTARRVGDLITIIISETSTASFNASTSLSKNDSNGLNNDFVNGFLNRIIGNVSTGGSSSNDGKGTTAQTGKLSARLTAVVKAITPQGNLVIEGTRSLVVNREIQSFQIGGVVRRDDVRADNTVLSENIADAEIKMVGKGAIYDRQRRGLLTRVLDWLF